MAIALGIALAVVILAVGALAIRTLVQILRMEEPPQ